MKRKKRKIQNVIFDADGTLLDTNYHYVELYHRAYQRFGWDVPKYKIHRVVGMGHDKAIPLLTSPVWYRKNHKEFERYASSLYRKEYLKKSKLFPGAWKLVKTLQSKGYLLALASSSPSPTVKHYLTLFPRHDIFKYVTTFCDIENSKPEPDAFLAILERGGLKKSETVVVGDSIWDMQASRSCGIKAVGILSGGGFGKEELLRNGASEIYWDPSDLLRNLSRSLICRS